MSLNVEFSFNRMDTGYAKRNLQHGLLVLCEINNVLLFFQTKSSESAERECV